MSDGHASEQELLQDEAAAADLENEGGNAASAAPHASSSSAALEDDVAGADSPAAEGDGAVAAQDAEVLDGELLLDADAPDTDAAEPQAQAAADPAEKMREYLALAQRTQADFENYRKRASREAALAQERGIGKLAKELLPAIDNLERAVQAAEAANDPLIDGVKLVQAEILSALARVGIEPFSPAGEQFDPKHHEAVAQAPIAGASPGTVVEVYQQGFQLGETVLRPARVLVAS